ncbi:hypothetical protein EV102420_37_00310 [Pseudescherichia vulneris NBRC 102420]|uniref:Uncharacterized protein n=1 Tax=Pseudescherichia vulneris NBRC 102420 TaxID=1115515 RepID=A0A090VYP7_PSEVU|nr:hypothetical protein [Pseudescherichia vulneris]GAL60392.1 hypothetical protein EV102420_37_00310 [Pseudescherichia vulneris NBRC 102420]
MKKVLILMLVCTSYGAAAQCIGSGALSTCYDDNGNTYTVSRMGNTTVVNGSSANGSSWSQTSNTIGNSTYTNGTASNGRNWNETQTNMSGGNRMISGVNSQGQSYSHYCNQFGCN